MGSAEARRQLKAGLWAIRRIASTLDSSAESLAAEIVDMEQALAQLDCNTSDCPAGPPRARHVALQACLADVERRVQAARADGDTGEDKAMHTPRALPPDARA